MAINAKKRAAKKDVVATPKKLKAEAEVPSAKQGKKTPKKGAQNGSPAPQKGKKAAASNGNTPANSNKKGRGKKTESTPEQLEKSKKNAQKAKQEAATYLNTWENDKAKWKFNKNIQTWLIVHAFNPELVSEKTFETALAYFEGAVGFARKRVLDCAVNLIKKFEEKTLGDGDQVKMDRAQRIAKIGSEATKGKATPEKKKGKGAAQKTPKAKTPAKSPKRGNKKAAKKAEAEEDDEESD